MLHNTRKPPDGRGGLSGNSVVADRLDASRDKATSPKKQSGNLRGLRPIGHIAAEVVADLRFRREVQKLHALGPRATAEFIGELGAERGIRTIIDKKLRRYAALDPKTLEATGGSDFWPAPLHEVQP